MANFCQEPGCSGLAMTGKFCPLHIADNYQKHSAAVRSPYDSWYGRRAWNGRNGIRLVKLRRNPLCEICATARATQVHHTDPSWKLTGDWSLFIKLALLQSLCASCHSRITAEENS